jgi:hypothetical protein
MFVRTNMQLANWRTEWEDNVEKDVEDTNKPRKKVLRMHWEGREYVGNTENTFWRICRYEISYVIARSNFLQKKIIFLQQIWGTW